MGELDSDRKDDSATLVMYVNVLPCVAASRLKKRQMECARA